MLEVEHKYLEGVGDAERMRTNQQGNAFPGVLFVSWAHIQGLLQCSPYQLPLGSPDVNHHTAVVDSYFELSRLFEVLYHLRYGPILSFVSQKAIDCLIEERLKPLQFDLILLLFLVPQTHR